MLYVYGVVRAGQRPPTVRGVGPGSVRFVESGPLAAAVTEVDPEFALAEDDATVHLDVQIALLADGPVVPLRLGTVLPDEAALRADVLEADRAVMLRRLDALADVVEMYVDADDDEAEAIAAVAGAAERGPVSGDLDAQLELGRQVAELLVEHRARLADELLAALRPHAVADQPRAVITGPEDPVLRWAFLVRRDAVDDFDQAVAAARSHHPGLLIRHVGPLPAAHFVDWEPAADAVGFGGRSDWGF